MCVVFGSAWMLSCAPQQPPTEDRGGPSLQETEMMYLREYLNMAEVFRQIKSGNAEVLAKQIEESMPAYLKRINTFESPNMKSAGFIVAGNLANKYGLVLPADIVSGIKEAEKTAGKVLSDDCYDLMECTAPGCVAWPTSLRAANVNSPNIMGWHYIKDSHCGFSWPKFWKLECGPPIALVPCRNSG